MFWDTTKPDRPTGDKDPEAVLDYPIDFSEWFLAQNDTYLNHEVTTAGGLVCDSSQAINNVIIPVISGGNLGDLGKFTIKLYTTNGRVDKRSFYLKIKER